MTYKWNTEGIHYLTNDIDKHIFAGPGASEEANNKVRAVARNEAYKLLNGTEVGLIAQDVERVLPQLVRANTAGYKSIRYDLLTALLVEAIKEQKEAIRDLENQLEALASSMK